MKYHAGNKENVVIQYFLETGHFKKEDERLTLRIISAILVSLVRRSSGNCGLKNLFAYHMAVFLAVCLGFTITTGEIQRHQLAFFLFP